MLTDTRTNIYQASEVDFLRIVVSFLILMEVLVPTESIKNIMMVICCFPKSILEFKAICCFCCFPNSTLSFKAISCCYFLNAPLDFAAIWFLLFRLSHRDCICWSLLPDNEIISFWAPNWNNFEAQLISVNNLPRSFWKWIRVKNGSVD